MGSASVLDTFDLPAIRQIERKRTWHDSSDAPASQLLLSLELSRFPALINSRAGMNGSLSPPRTSESR